MGFQSHRVLNRAVSRQPTQFTRVNWGNPLSHKLSYLANLGIGTIDATGFANAASAATFAGSAKIGSALGYSGLVLTGGASDAATFNFLPNNFPAGASQRGTIEVRFAFTAVGTRAHIFGFGDQDPITGGTCRRFIAFNGTGPCNIYFQGGTGDDVDSTVLWPIDGFEHSVFVSFGNGAQNIVLDGTSIKTGTTTQGTLAGTQKMYFGSHIASGSVTPTGVITKAAVYLDWLTLPEMQELTVEPWQQFQNFNTVRRAFAPPAAASGQPGRPYYDRFISRI